MFHSPVELSKELLHGRGAPCFGSSLAVMHRCRSACLIGLNARDEEVFLCDRRCPAPIVIDRHAKSGLVRLTLRRLFLIIVGVVGVADCRVPVSHDCLNVVDNLPRWCASVGCKITRRVVYKKLHCHFL